MRIIIIGGNRLSPAQLAILMLLRRGPLKTSVIVEKLGKLGIISRSTAYAAIKELERKGLVEVDENRYCRLTERGLSLAEAVTSVLRSEIDRLSRYLTFLIEVAGYGEAAEAGGGEWRRVPIE